MDYINHRIMRFAKTLPKPFDGFDPHTEILSSLTKGRDYSNVSSSMARALLYLFYEEKIKGRPVIVRDAPYTYARYVSEYRVEEEQFVCINDTAKLITGFVWKLRGRSKMAVYDLSEHSNAAILISIFPYLRRNKEFSEAENDFYEAMNRDDLVDAFQALALASDNCYERLKTRKGCYPLWVKCPDKQLEHPRYPKRVRDAYGTAFIAPCKKNAPAEPAEPEVKHEAVAPKIPTTFAYSYAYTAPRTAEEREATKLPDYVIVPDWVKNVCLHVQKTTGTNMPIRNIMVAGDAGSGKTFGAWAIAEGLDKTRRIVTLSANTSIEELLSSPYVEDGVVKYRDSDFLRAIRNGDLIELQEPTTILQPGVLVGLNSLLEPNGTIMLPNGEVVRRHPDTVVVMTTNLTYEGCRAMNESVIDRMDLFVTVNTPSISEMTDRVISLTGCNNRPLVEAMVRVVKTTEEYCKKNGIPGVVGMRSLIQWVNSAMITGDAYGSALLTVVNKATADEMDRQSIITTCLEPVFLPGTGLKAR